MIYRAAEIAGLNFAIHCPQNKSYGMVMNGEDSYMFVVHIYKQT